MDTVPFGLDDSTELAGLHKITDGVHFRVEPPHVPDHENAGALFCTANHVAALLGVDGHGLFDEHVFSVAHEVHAVGGMKLVRRGDNHRLNIVTAQQVPDVVGDMRDAVFSGELLGSCPIQAAQSAHLHTGHSTERSGMVVGNEPRTNQGNPHRFHDCHSIREKSYRSSLGVLIDLGDRFGDHIHVRSGTHQNVEVEADRFFLVGSAGNGAGRSESD